MTDACVDKMHPLFNVVNLLHVGHPQVMSIRDLRCRLPKTQSRQEMAVFDAWTTCCARHEIMSAECMSAFESRSCGDGGGVSAIKFES